MKQISETRPVGAAQQRRRALEPPGEQVLVRRLAERPAELAAEVGRREVRGPRERGHVERLAVARVDQVLGAQEVTCRRLDGQHRIPVSREASALWRATRL